MIKFRTNIYGFNKSDVIKFVNEVADEYESIYNKLKNATIQIESLNKELERFCEDIYTEIHDVGYSEGYDSAQCDSEGEGL